MGSHTVLNLHPRSPYSCDIFGQRHRPTGSGYFGTSASGGLPPFCAVPQIRHNNPHDGGSLGCHMHMLECIAALIPWNWVEMSVCLCLKLTAPFRSTLLQRSRGNFWCLKCYVAVIFCFSCASCFLKLAKQIKF